MTQAAGVGRERSSEVGRFAPSTTGSAHPGTLLAGLLCWLDARVDDIRTPGPAPWTYNCDVACIEVVEADQVEFVVAGAGRIALPVIAVPGNGIVPCVIGGQR